MSIPAIRGYMRAQAGGCVGTRLDEVLARRRLESAMRPRVLEAAIEQLVAMVIHDVLAGAPAVNERSLAA
jgi:hypothetical protein